MAILLLSKIYQINPKQTKLYIQKKSTLESLSNFFTEYEDMADEEIE